MARVAFDTNVLIYAELEPDSPKGARAQQLLIRAAGMGVIAVQALGEFLRKVQRSSPGLLDQAIAQTASYASHFLTPETSHAVLSAAAELSRDHKLQTWDAVIIVASVSAGAKVLLSEDMQDGRSVAGLRIINPFDPANTAAVDALFPV